MQKNKPTGLWMPWSVSTYRYTGSVRATVVSILFIVLSGCLDRSAENAAPVATPSELPGPAAVALNNRGVGLMGRFDYVEAEKVFVRLLAEAPNSVQAKINLAIATLNRQQEGDEQAALGMMEDLIRTHPDQLNAHYLAGLLRLYLSSPEQALAHFRKVAEADPRDPYAAYYLAQCLFQVGESEQALHWYRLAIDLDPYLRSAYYGAFQALRRLGERAQAKAMVADYQRLANNPRARLVEFKYTRMGSKAEALAFDSQRGSIATVKVPHGEVFAPLRMLDARGPEPDGGLPSERRVGISRADLGGKRRPLLMINGAGPESAPNRVFALNEQGDAVALPDHPLSTVPKVNAALWGDYDNDGLTDVYLLRRDSNQLWRQHPEGQWRDVTVDTNSGGGDRDSVDGLFVDADHDGDLDLFLVNADGANELLNNDLNGSFRPIAAQQGIAGDSSSLQVVAADLDGDRDLDLVVINKRPPHRVYRNDRLWDYQTAPGFEAFSRADIAAAVVGDWDSDGWVEVYTSDARGRVSRWVADRDGQWGATRLGTVPRLAAERAQLALGDVDGDGVLDLVAGSALGWSALSLDDEGLREFAAADQPSAAWRLLLLHPGRGPVILAVGEDAALRLWPAGPGRYPFLVLSLSGMADPGQAMRSNASGIGARVAVRSGSHWSLLNTLRADSASGQSLAPLVVGLAGSQTTDFVSIDWSDGVFQSELALATGRVHRITETQRQLSSCPLLFAWDGRRYRFVSDLLGVGGIGYAVGRGEYASPRPWENFLFPAGLLQARDGRYRVKIGEPMEEVAYLDAVRLVAYDLPPGWGMVLDERMAINDPQPSGSPRFFRSEWLPTRVVNGRGEDLSAALRSVDARAAPVGPLDRRFIGRLAGEQVLTLSFDRRLDEGPGEALLVIDGWVEYPYSQTQFAAWQAGATFRAPTLEARSEQGEWRTVLTEFGYPAGMPRRMSVPLEGLPQGTRELRLSTNMEVYWDRIAVVFSEPPPQLMQRELPLSAARLASVGFPLRTTAAQRYPSYDYQRRAPFWDVNYQSGWYTRPGPVAELVRDTDDALALVGPGDEVHLEFDAPAEHPQQGWVRFLVLETNGWAKDRDLFTRDGETVAPLPSSGKPHARAESLHARYNTRYQDGR